MNEIVARDIMQSEVLRVQENMSVREVSTFLTSSEISGAPVEDRDGRLVGFVSLTDIALAASSNKASAVRDQSHPEFFVRGWEDRLEMSELGGFYIEDEGLLVKQIMTSALYQVDEATSIREVARMMLDGHLHRVLVTRDERVVGIITTLDLLKLLV